MRPGGVISLVGLAFAAVLLPFSPATGPLGLAGVAGCVGVCVVCGVLALEQLLLTWCVA